MYAIVRTGGKQAKVQPGDVIDIELVRSSGDEVELTPLLVVDDDGNVHSGREAMKGIKVQAKVVGQGAGAKVDIFKYKAKTGYRRRQGHRQKFTTIEVDRHRAPGCTQEGREAYKGRRKGLLPRLPIQAPTSCQRTPISRRPRSPRPRPQKKSPTALKKQASAEADPKEA